jgi:hypothetical protein
MKSVKKDSLLVTFRTIALSRQKKMALSDSSSANTQSTLLPKGPGKTIGSTTHIKAVDNL